MPPTAPSCGAVSVAPLLATSKTRYGSLWDAFSDAWDSYVGPNKPKYLGDEWGPEEHVRHIIDNFVRPYVQREHRVLEIGPGGGRYTQHLLTLCSEVTGVDASDRMLQRLFRRFASHPRARFLQNSGHDLSILPSRSFQFACAFNVFVQIEIEDVYAYLTELKRVLVPGGVAALHYADLSNPEGWKYFDACRTTWAERVGQIGRFTELTLAAMAMLAERAGLEVVRNHYVGRDSMIVVRNPDFASAPPAPAPESDSHARRNYQHIDRYLDQLGADVYHEMPTAHHTAAAVECVDAMAASLPIDSVVELGCGAAPSLDRFKALGKQTLGVSLGAEECAHRVVRADAHFSGLAASSADLVVARHILEHSPMPIFLLMEIHRISRRYALVVVPCDEDIWIQWPNHYSVLSKAMWRKLFARAKFNILQESDGPLEPASTEWRFLLEKES